MYVFPADRLPRNRHDINRMTLDNPDRPGFINAEKSEIQSILNMGTYNPTEILPNPISITYYKTMLPKPSKPTYVFPADRLPRNRHDIDRMALDNLDRQGFINAKKTEIQSILNMGTYNPNETLPNPINKTLLGN